MRKTKKIVKGLEVIARLDEDADVSSVIGYTR